MNGNAPVVSSESVPVASPAQSHRDTVEYVGFRVDGRGVVLNLSEHRRLSLERSLDLVNHSPSGFEWGYSGSGPAQLACALLLDYYDEQVAREHYIAFRNQVVTQLECDGAAACWHLTGEEIDDAMATITVKEINDNRYYYYYYWQWREGEQVKSRYKGPVNPDD